MLLLTVQGLPCCAGLCCSLLCRAILCCAVELSCAVRTRMSPSQARAARRASSAMTKSAPPPSATTWRSRIGATLLLATHGGLVRPGPFRVRGSVQVPGRGLIPGRPRWANKGAVMSNSRARVRHGRPYRRTASRAPDRLSSWGKTKTRSTSGGSSPSDASCYLTSGKREPEHASFHCHTWGLLW